MVYSFLQSICNKRNRYIRQNDSHLLAMTGFSDAILPGIPGVTNEVRVKAAADVLEFVV